MHQPVESARSRTLPFVASPDDLRRAQIGLSLLGNVVQQTEFVALSSAVGRITANRLALPPRAQFGLVATQGEDALAEIPAGVRLEVWHLPALASTGVTSVEVYVRLRVGIVTLVDPPHTDDRADTLKSAARACATGTTLVGLVERLGAQAFEARCSTVKEATLSTSLEMFLSRCDLVLVAGFLNPVQASILRSALLVRDADASVEDVVLRPVGALQVGRSGSKLVVAVSADFGTAFSSFALLVSPLIRRMQGRRTAVAAPAQAQVAPGDEASSAPWGIFPVREVSGPGTLRPTLEPCAPGDSAHGIAQATGFAWRPGGHRAEAPPVVAFYPFHHWLS